MQRSTQNNETYQQEVEYGSGYGYGSTGDSPGFGGGSIAGTGVSTVALRDGKGESPN